MTKFVAVFWPAVLILATLVSTSVQAHRLDIIESCKRVVTKQSEVAVVESLSHGEADYREVDGLKYGTIARGQIFFQYLDGRLLLLEDVSFQDQSHAALQLRSEQLSVERSEIFKVSDRKGTLFCMLVPFSGLGSSGTYQGYVALIAASISGSSDFAPVGEVLRRPPK